MAGNTPTQLPAFIQLRYEENGVFDKLESAAEHAAAQTKKRFNQAFSETERVVTGAVGRMSSQFGKLDLGVGQFQKEAADIRLYREALAEVSRTAEQLARETGDTSVRTKEYLQALSAQRAEADRALAIADAQVSTYTRLQGALDGAADANSRLAQAQREAERAGRPQPANAGPTNTRTGVDALVAGQAAIDRAALSGATLESVLGRVANKGRDVQLALEASARAAEEAAAAEAKALAAQGPIRANPGPTNTLVGVDALVAGQAAMDRAAISGTTLEQVLGRVANKGQSVTASINAAAAASERAAADQARMAAAVDRLNAELDPAAAATQRLAAQTKALDDALAAGAIDAQRHAQMMRLVNQANHEGTNATRSVINSQRSFRVAMIQSGQQMQDLAISIYSGQRASVVFAQQLPQLAFALTGLEGSTNKTYDKIGRFATLLSGPMGLAVGLGVGILGTLAYELLATGDAAEEATAKTYDFSDGLDVMTLSAKEGADAMAQLANEMRSAIAVQGDFLRMKAQLARQSATDIEAQISSNNARLAKLRSVDRVPTLGSSINGVIGIDPIKAEIKSLTEQNKELAKSLSAAQAAAFSGDIAESQQRVIDSLDAATAATTRYNVAVGELNQQRKKSKEDPVGASASGVFITQDQYEAEFKRLTELKNAEVEAAREAEKSTRKKLGGTDKAAREAERLQRFGERAEDAIGRINDRFAEQPRLVVQADRAVQDLDDIIADLEKRQPPGFEQLIADAEKAKGVVEDALVRPFRDLVEESQRRLQIQELLAQGREDEADALTEIWRTEDQLGDLSAQRKDDIRDLIRYEKQRSRELERQRYLFEAQLDVIDQARSSLTDVLSGRSTNFFKDMKQAFMDLQGKRLFDSMFGDLFRDLEDELRGQSPLGKESAKLAGEMHVATDATSDLVDAFRYGANAIRDAAASARASTSTGSAFDAAFAGYGSSPAAANDNGYIDANGDIVVTRTKGSGKDGEIVIAHRSVTDLADGVAGAMVSPLEEALGSVFGTGFAQMLGGVLKGALSGYLTGGAPGGILGGLKGIVDGTGIFGGADGGLSSLLGKGIGGATTGTQTAGIMKSLGIKTSTTGAQIGGTIGSFLPIPGGEIIGSAVGGLLGGLFKKTKWARVLLGSGGNQLQSNSGKYEDAVTAAGDSFNQSLANIADALGGSLGDYGGITLGVRHGDWRVNTGGTSLKKKNGAVDFDGDQEAAMKYAIMQAIDRGAIAGIRESTNRLLKAGNDLDAALQDALDWENAFKELKAYKDPVGAALDGLDQEFEKLIDLADKAGASAEEMAQLEELYGIKRNEIIKEQAERLIGSLKDLYSDLTTGDNGLSLRDRRANALSEYDALKARVDAGDTTAYDDYAAAARNLLDIERQLYGSQQEYFDRLNEVTTTTKGRIDAETNVISIAENRDSPFDSAGRVNASITDQTDALVSRLDAANSNLGAILAAIAGGNSNVSIRGLSFSGNY